MNAIRRDEDTDNLHSIYVDQWDWEKIIGKEERTIDTLKTVVNQIYEVLKRTEMYVASFYPQIKPVLPKHITFVTTAELEDRYCGLTTKERERQIVKEHGAVFLMGIGGALRNGKPHDGRAPDYDDWTLNGDIIVDYPMLDTALELSSMGIRVDAKALRAQLEIAGCMERAELPFQKALLNNELPDTIGGGIGQSRICMFSCAALTLVRCRRLFGRRKPSGSARNIISICCENSSGGKAGSAGFHPLLFLFSA